MVVVFDLLTGEVERSAAASRPAAPPAPSLHSPRPALHLPDPPARPSAALALAHLDCEALIRAVEDHDRV